MSESHPNKAPGTPYELTASLLSNQVSVPDMLVIDADNVLWPCSSHQLQPDTQVYAAGPGVLEAAHAKGLKLAVIVSQTQPQTVSAEGAVQSILDRSALAGIIDIVHVQEVQQQDQHPGQQVEPASIAQLQAGVEAHWKSLRAAAGVQWSRCLALVGSKGAMRAANRVGAANVLVTSGLTPDVVDTGLQLFAAKAEDERGF